MLFGDDVEIHHVNFLASRAHILVEYRDAKILYDLDDGYQNIDGIKKDILICDLYFKRSFSSILNKDLGLDVYRSKMFPLGFNYDVALKGRYYGVPATMRSRLRDCLSSVMPTQVRRMLYPCLPENIEMLPSFKADSHKPVIMFYTRLWSGDENRGINEMRIGIIRELRKKYGEMFRGGLCDSPLARQMAPDLIQNRFVTGKYFYLKRVHKADICIASTGLFNSIGWKTAEYIVASKAVCCEKLCYEVPGNWEQNINYIEFDSVDSCIEAVDYLTSHPEEIVAMQNANRDYYLKHLKPDVLVARTLSLCERC